MSGTNKFDLKDDRAREVAEGLLKWIEQSPDMTMAVRT